LLNQVGRSRLVRHIGAAGKHAIALGPVVDSRLRGNDVWEELSQYARRPDAILLVLVPVRTEVSSEKGRAGEEEEDPTQQADYVPVPQARHYKEQCGDGEEDPSPELVPLDFMWTFTGHVSLLPPQL
jgi:hypothetical protein